MLDNWFKSYLAIVFRLLSLTPKVSDVDSITYDCIKQVDSFVSNFDGGSTHILYPFSDVLCSFNFVMYYLVNNSAVHREGNNMLTMFKKVLALTKRVLSAVLSSSETPLTNSNTAEIHRIRVAARNNNLVANCCLLAVPNASSN